MKVERLNVRHATLPAKNGTLSAYVPRHLTIYKHDNPSQSDREPHAEYHDRDLYFSMVISRSKAVQ